MEKDTDERIMMKDVIGIDGYHLFLMTTIKSWFDTGKNTCPTCRKKIKDSVTILVDQLQGLDNPDTDLKKLYLIMKHLFEIQLNIEAYEIVKPMQQNQNSEIELKSILSGHLEKE